MAHFHPTINRYEKPDRQVEIATKPLSEDGFLEDPIAKTVPIGWKGKCSSKREYSTSTQNEEFWNAFNFGDEGPEPARDQTADLGAGHQQRGDRVNESNGPDGRISGIAIQDMEGLVHNDSNKTQSSVDHLRTYHIHKEQQRRSRIQDAIEKVPECRRATLELCEVNRQKRWNAWLAEVLKSNLNDKEISQQSIIGAQRQFPVEFPVGRAIDKQNNKAVNLRLYTECVKHGGVLDDTRAAPELPDDVKALIALLNQSLPSEVEIGGAHTVLLDEGKQRQDPNIPEVAQLERPVRDYTLTKTERVNLDEQLATTSVCYESSAKMARGISASSERSLNADGTYRYTFVGSYPCDLKLKIEKGHRLFRALEKRL